MDILDISELFIATGLFCFMLVVMMIGSFLLSHRGPIKLQILINDYKDKSIAYGGPLGIMRILVLGGFACIILGAVVRLFAILLHILG